MNMHSPNKAHKFADFQGPLPRGWDEGDRYIAERAWPRCMAEIIPRAVNLDDCGCLTCGGTGTIARFSFAPCHRCDGTGFKTYMIHKKG